MTNPTTNTPFSAADSALGYLYQVRLGLWLAVQRLAEGETFALNLETLVSLDTWTTWCSKPWVRPWTCCNSNTIGTGLRT